MRSKQQGMAIDQPISTTIQKRVLFEKRIILLHDIIDAYSSRYIVEDLIALDQMEKKTITLHINSPGGDMDLFQKMTFFNWKKKFNG